MPQKSPVRFFAIRVTINEDWKSAKTTFEDWCEKMMDNYIFQVENTTDNYHIQAYVKTKEKTRDGTLTNILIKKFEGHSVYCAPASDAGKETLKFYCMKEASRVAGPWADCEQYLGADLIMPQNFNPFQKKCLEYFLWLRKHEGDDRRTDWYYDGPGCGGKSKIAKYLAWKFPKEVCLITCWKAWDILKVAAAHPNRKLYIINLSKAKPQDIGRQDLYAAIEGIKDGMWTDTKGTAKQILMNSAAVWVFANHAPARKEMAQERFTIRKVPSMPEHMKKKPIVFDFGDACPIMSEEEIKRLEAEYDFCEES